MKRIAFALALPVLILAGCTTPGEDPSVKARGRYLAAKAECEATYPDRFVAQSDCRTAAADQFIRPYYRYGDLMTRLQMTRRKLAADVDRHRLSPAAFARAVARAERESAREEQRRNEAAGL